MQQKKCENDLKKALKESNDKAIHAIYAKQVGQCRKMKTRLLNNKVKMNGMMYSIESMFSNYFSRVLALKFSFYYVIK